MLVIGPWVRDTYPPEAFWALVQFDDHVLEATNNGLSRKRAILHARFFPLLCNGFAYSSHECGGPGSNYFRLTVTTNPKQADTEHQKG